MSGPFNRRASGFNSEEAKIQKAIFFWANSQSLAHPELRWLFAIPNGALRDPKVARELAAQGVRSGVSDILLPVANGTYSGLFIEIKTETGAVSPAQKVFGEFVLGQGYAFKVCRGADQAIMAVKDYLGIL